MRQRKEFVTGGAKSRLLVFGLSVAGVIGPNLAVSAQDVSTTLQLSVLTLPPERSLPIPPASSALSADSAVLQGIGEAGARLAQMDSLSEATVTVQTGQGPVAVGARVLRNGLRGQHIELKQADGRFVNVGAGPLDPVVRRVLDVLQMPHDRGLGYLLEAEMRDASVRDEGAKADGTQAFVVLEANGAATRYTIDGTASRVVQMEFQRGWSPNASGRSFPNLESYVFSDFRNVTGLPTPFKIERYVNGIKQDEVLFSSVRYVPSNRDTSPGPITGGNR